MADAGGHILPIRQQVDHHDVHMGRDLRELVPEIGHVGIGHRLAHGGAHAIDVGNQLGRRQVAAQQHFVAHHQAFDGIGVTMRQLDGARHLKRVLCAVAAQPDALPHLQAVPLRDGRDVVRSFDGGVCADGARDRGEQRKVPVHFGRGWEMVGQRRFTVSVALVGQAVELLRLRARHRVLQPVGPPPQGRHGRGQQEQKGVALHADGGSVWANRLKGGQWRWTG